MQKFDFLVKKSFYYLATGKYFPPDGKNQEKIMK